MTTGENGERPLADIKVLDASRVVSGPFAGRILSDLGADVVKLEPPFGDETHAYGLDRGGLSGAYIQHNVGKRNISLDLKSPDGRQVFCKLAAQADLVIENFRPGVLDRLGIGWEVMSSANPRLILLSISGFGQTGPAVGRRAYAPVIHAETGLVARQAMFDGTPPSDPMPSIADTNAALHGVVAVLAALNLRRRTGLGQHIDIAMTDSMVASDDYAHHALDRFPIVRVGGDVWDAVGGQILTAGLFNVVWPLFERAFGSALDASHDGVNSDSGRRRAVQEWFSSFPDRGDLESALNSAGIPWAAVRLPMEVFESPWAVARGCAVEIDDRMGGHRLVVQSPYRFSNAASGVHGRIARRGEDNAFVLEQWLGLSAAEIERLSTAGVLSSDASAVDRDARATFDTIKGASE